MNMPEYPEGSFSASYNYSQNIESHLGNNAWLVNLTAADCYDQMMRLDLTSDEAKYIWVAREHLTGIDKLTGLPNKDRFDEELTRRVEELHRLPSQERYPLAVTFADMNRLKRLNTRFGHDNVDKIIGLIGSLIAASYRAYDLPTRRSGDEFQIVQPHANLLTAMKCALRTQVLIRENIPDLITYLRKNTPKPLKSLDLSLAFGVTEMDFFNNDSPDKITTRADFAMYQAKEMTHRDPNLEAISLSKATGEDVVSMVFTYHKNECRSEMIPELDQRLEAFINSHHRRWLLNQITVTPRDIEADYQRRNAAELYQLYHKINNPWNRSNRQQPFSH